MLVYRYFYAPELVRVADRRGYAEKVLRKRLEKLGWIVWRGDGIRLLKKDDLYPNVLRKYSLLKSLLDTRDPSFVEFLQYLSAVHHGLPDFLCYAQGRFVFIECKLCHEQLSKKQKLCLARLHAKGFSVEVHVLVDKRTKKRLVVQSDTKKRIIEKQQTLRHYQ